MIIVIDQEIHKGKSKEKIHGLFMHIKYSKF